MEENELLQVTDLVKRIEEADEINEKRNSIQDLIDLGNTNDEVVGAICEYLKVDDRGMRDVCSRFFLNIDEEHRDLAASHVVKLIELTDITLRNIAGDILLNYGYTAIPHLIPYLQCHDMDVRKFALDIIGIDGGENELDFIYPMISDKDKNVRMSVFEAIGNICTKLPEDEDYYLAHRVEATEFMIEHYAEEEENRVFIIESLAKMGLQEAEDFLLRVISDEEDFFLQIAAIDALALKCERIEICDNLLMRIAEFDELVQPVVLKTVNAIAFRVGEHIPLDDSYRFIAHNAIRDEDEDIRMAGIISLGDEIQNDDVCLLAQVYDQLNQDVQGYILERIIINSPCNVISHFLNEYFQQSVSSSIVNREIEMLSIITNFAGEMPDDRLEKIIHHIVELVIKIVKDGENDIIEFLLVYCRDMVLDKLRQMISESSGEMLAEILDLILHFELVELQDSLPTTDSISDEVIIDKINIICNL